MSQSRIHQPWNEKDLATLRYARNRMTDRELAKVLRRTRTSVGQKRYALGESRKRIPDSRIGEFAQKYGVSRRKIRRVGVERIQSVPEATRPLIFPWMRRARESEAE